jgi:hypothetical protein
MKAYAGYVDGLERLLLDSSQTSELKHKAAIAAALDGQPSAELRRCISIARLRSAGAFFTGSGAHLMGPLAQPALVDEDDGAPLAERFF